MFTPRHPAPPQSAPPQPHTPSHSPEPHHPPHHQAPPPQHGIPPQAGMPPRGGMPPQGNPLQIQITEADLELLKEILNNDNEAQSLYAMLQNSPPEIAGLGYLVLRAFERGKS